LLSLGSESKDNNAFSSSDYCFDKIFIMELGLCLFRIIHRDITLTNIVIRPSCLEACDDYEPGKSEDVDSIEAEENSVNRHIYDLNCEINGTREWFEVLGSMIANLTNLNQLTFDGIDPEYKYLERFWGEVSASNSLTSITFANINLERSEEILCAIGAPNIRNVCLALLPSITSLEFISCAFDVELSMCLVRCLREERVRLGLGLVQINLV